ncbi:MAG: CoA-binding protein [Candidatus Lokiarchaeota archaeon]|nr:CoA-binding protein [Candidatus Lokiarchaeota archaeon]
MNENHVDFTPLFYPKTMAVIGASTNAVGAVKYVKAHLNSGIKVYPVNSNPKYTELEGLPVYRSVVDIEDDIDLAIIGVPKELVPGVIEDFKRKVVKFAVIFTSGFKESGRDDLERSVLSGIKGVETRFIGPNCLGVYHPRGSLTYFPTFPTGPEVAGNVSFVSQSGGHTAKTNWYLFSRGVHFAKTISIGNSIDLAAHDFLPYFKDDPDTAVVGFYIESTRDGRAFMSRVREVTPVKPVVIWKGGQGSVGYKATASHTGELAGNFTLWHAMARQAGAIMADDFDVLVDLLTMFSYRIQLPRSNRIAIVACGGGNAVETADIFEAGGFAIPELQEETKRQIGKFIPDINSAFTNPVDLGEYGYVPEYFANAVEIVSRDPSVDAIVYIKESSRFPMFSVNFNMPAETYEAKTIDTLAAVNEKNKTTGRNIPLYLNDPFFAEDIESLRWRVSFRDKMASKGIPVFNRVDVLMKTIKKAQEYSEFLDDVRGGKK